jgi:pyridoxal phosphate enzyme (YggS family)
MSAEITSISQNLELVRDKIDKAAKIYYRDAKEINLVVVSKTIASETIEQAIDCGCKIFGENKVIEAKTKWVNLKNQHKNIKLHLIGHLQTNKIKDAVALFDVIETVDSEKLAQELHKEMVKQNKFPEIFVQINIGEEEQKHGINPQDAKDFISKISGYLKVSGVMAIPPQDQDPALYFALLRKIAIENNLKNISMGMSSDFETAIALGANFIRLGTAVFGERI